MKVKIIETEEIVEVEKKGDYYIDKHNNLYTKDEVKELPSEKEIDDFISKTIIEAAKSAMNEKERHYWRDVRKEITIELIRRIPSNEIFLAKDIVEQADNVVRFLKMIDK